MWDDRKFADLARSSGLNPGDVIDLINNNRISEDLAKTLGVERGPLQQLIDASMAHADIQRITPKLGIHFASLQVLKDQYGSDGLKMLILGMCIGKARR